MNKSIAVLLLVSVIFIVYISIGFHGGVDVDAVPLNEELSYLESKEPPLQWISNVYEFLLCR